MANGGASGEEMVGVPCSWPDNSPYTLVYFMVYLMATDKGYAIYLILEMADSASYLFEHRSSDLVAFRSLSLHILQVWERQLLISEAYNAPLGRFAFCRNRYL